MLNATFSTNQTLNASFSTSNNLSASIDATVFVPIQQDYTGAYDITPSAQAQTLSTEDLHMLHNVTIAPIPSNYGLITYNGSIITVS